MRSAERRKSVCPAPIPQDLREPRSRLRFLTASATVVFALMRTAMNKVLLALFVASSPLEAQEPVADLSVLEALHFDGAKSFTPAALRKGLQSDLDFLLAAHPAAPLRDYLRTIEKRLTEGYLRAGFPEVVASAVVSTTATKNETDSGRRIVVKISEGPRFMCGDIRVTGARKVPADFFVRHLEKIGALSPTNDSGIRWTNSVGAPFSETTRRFISQYATNAFLDIGFAAPRFEVKLTPDPRRGVADLILDIKDEGPKTFVGEIDILARTRIRRKRSSGISG